jgi:hypothetical protein
MRTTRMLNTMGQNEVEGIFSDLEQKVEQGTSVVFSFPSPGRVMVLCATSQDHLPHSSTSEKTIYS